jgi:hypothetical protein
MRHAHPLAVLAALLVIAAGTSAARAQSDVCAAIAALDRAAPDGFVALRAGAGARAIPPSGVPFMSFPARALLDRSIAPRITVPDRGPAGYWVQFSDGSDTAFRRFAAQIDACSVHSTVAEPTPCERERGCARTWNLRSGAALHLRYQPAVIDLAFVAPAMLR